ncbi:RSP_2648 family PIN domain-containing protein [Anianabacter salinae]|uniref:RSP_2648 family PIN domain-containing protein n=1 Tax=Anianabacter salinae TaxID=2851023 RepID=UPI00225E2A12|nr:PIN domain-containing protein [Anianabacter salinae]MBV0911591.1 PIN domain-containing protein [Anianabacter salinae]
MKALLDACVLYPTVMREVLIACAARGLFTPLWSARILEEWARAARKLGPGGEAQARGEIALLARDWPAAAVPPSPGTEQRLWLPDPADVHVLAAAIAGSADVLVTSNAQDFPRQTLADEGLQRMDPDQFLRALHTAHPEAVAEAVEAVRRTAERLSGQPWETRALLKKARLPRLGKMLG